MTDRYLEERSQAETLLHACDRLAAFGSQVRKYLDSHAFKIFANVPGYLNCKQNVKGPVSMGLHRVLSSFA